MPSRHGEEEPCIWDMKARVVSTEFFLHGHRNGTFPINTLCYIEKLVQVKDKSLEYFSRCNHFWRNNYVHWPVARMMTLSKLLV